MRYISTKGHTSVDLREAVVNCYAADGGIFIPEQIPVLPRAYFNNLEEMTLPEIAYVVANTFFGSEASAPMLKATVDEAFDFPVPLFTVTPQYRFLELFNGPTGTFKDVSARFMASFLRQMEDGAPAHATVLTATTGNTGAAIARAFADMDGVEVDVLYPAGGYRHGFGALDGVEASNVRLFEVAGNIADCKRMVRLAVDDPELNEHDRIVSANTHNIIRILPQIAYFFHAYGRLRSREPRCETINFAIPCGNLSNLVSAVIAKRMGLPIGKIIAGCTINDTLARVLDGSVAPENAVPSCEHTLAHAMDSGYPTNLPRLLALYDNDIDAIRRDIICHSVSDDDIAGTVAQFYHLHGYLIDPHTAVACCAKFRAMPDDTATVVLATAHPDKSGLIMDEILGEHPQQEPHKFRSKDNKSRNFKIAPSLPALKKQILKNK